MNLAIYSALILFFVLIFLWVIILYKFGDWKNWRLYYPTILFFWCGNFIAQIVFCNHHFWLYKNPLMSHTLTDFISMIFVFSSTTILYLQYYPRKFINQTLYILFWVSLYSAVEWVFVLLGGIVHQYGWTMWLSIIHNTYQFILLRIHQKKPILAWILACIILAIVMFIFKIKI